ncbi:MAG: hypothetical protein PHZ07_02340 [Patescibacteria group bacterium]|nr:hypothetical protein [Patescibacteria group bacterium]MDD4304240.1 hypothetical protein [Patescibacteria group bacterium]MDD4695294.1 hypothetical protein [Patescibacteria group bacterium]
MRDIKIFIEITITIRYFIVIFLYLIILGLYLKKKFWVLFYINLAICLYWGYTTFINIKLCSESSNCIYGGYILYPMILLFGMMLIFMISIILEIIYKKEQDKLNPQQVINNQNNQQ